MYHFAIDGNEANTTQRVGSNVYAYELLIALEKLTREKQEYSWTVLLSSPCLADLPAEREGWRYQVVTPRPLWTQIGLPMHLFLQRQKYDVFFTPGHYAPRVSSVPYISSVMDLAFLKYPKQFKRKDYLQLKEWTRYSVKHADKVLAISEFTKEEVVKTYKRNANDVFVAYPALPTAAPTEKASLIWLKKEAGIKDPFILYVGTLQPRKNLVQLIHAFSLFCDKYSSKKSTPQLVIAGKIGWLAKDILGAAQHSEYKDRIHLLGYVTDAQKELLYKKSECTVLIGQYEGFGIPPLEAMAHGTLPISANSSSLPEVMGEAGFQVTPTDTEELANTFQEVFKLTARQRAVLLKKGRLQLKKFSWQRSAEIILQEMIQVATDHGKQCP